MGGSTRSGGAGTGAMPRISPSTRPTILRRMLGKHAHLFPQHAAVLPRRCSIAGSWLLVARPQQEHSARSRLTILRVTPGAHTPECPHPATALAARSLNDGCT